MRKGRIHSFYAGGTVDGPGIRFVIFLQGCPMRCLYCHNPDTWDIKDGKEYDTDTVVMEALKYKSYFQNGGGVTVSGGEPLLQMEFVIELFAKLKERGIHTACDTSGILFCEEKKELFEELLRYTDLFLLDIKHIDCDAHQKLTGRSNTAVLRFATYLSEKKKPMWIRHVLVPTLTTQEESLKALKAFIDTLDTVEKVEVLPYHTMGKEKYKKMGLPYSLENINPPTKEEIQMAKDILGGKVCS